MKKSELRYLLDQEKRKSARVLDLCDRWTSNPSGSPMLDNALGTRVMHLRNAVRD